MTEVIGKIGPEGIEPVDQTKAEAEQTPETPSPADIEVKKQDAKTGREIKQQAETAIDTSGYLKIIHENLDSDETLNWVIPIVQKAMTEKFGDTAPSAEALAEVAGLMRHLESSISPEDLAKMTEMSTQDEFSGLAEKKDTIICSLCLPVLKGHLSVEDTKALVQKIALMKPGATGQSVQTHGYEGVMKYDPETGTILISPEVLQDKYIKESVDESGNKVSQEIKIDHAHLATHEMAHGLVARTGLDRERGEQSKALVAKAKEIIAAAEQIKDCQPMHIRNVLDTMSDAKIAQEYGKIKDPKESAEDYKNKRILSAANEIITDYAALYLQSDGSFKDFARVSLDKTEPAGLKQFLIKALNISVGTEQEKSMLVENKFKEIKTALAGDEDNIQTILAKNPGLQPLFETYKVFYKNIGAFAKEAKGNLAEDELDDDDLEYYDFGGGGFADAAGGFGQQDKFGTQKGDKFSLVGLMDAFASEVEITKSVTTAPAGGGGVAATG